MSSGDQTKGGPRLLAESSVAGSSKSNDIVERATVGAWADSKADGESLESEVVEVEEDHTENSQKGEHILVPKKV